MNVEGLPPAMSPPPGLEHRTANALRSAGLIGNARWRRAAGVAALVAVAFLSGWIARGTAVSRQPVTESPRFAFLLYGGEADGGSEADRVREYREWARGLASQGHFVSGEKLDDAATLAGPDVPNAVGLRGFFIVDAASDEEARRIAATHPHLRHGGTVVVRRIVRT